MAYRVLYSQSDIQNVAGGATLPAAPVGTLSACSLKIINQSQYGIDLITSNQHVDHVPPYSWITLPKGMFNDISVSINTDFVIPTIQPNSFISATTINGVVMYAVGSVFQPNQDTNITGSTSPLQTEISGGNPVPTDLGYGMSRDVGGGVVYAASTGIVTVTFQKMVQQIYIEHRGQSGDITFTGDEDPTLQTSGILLSPGSSLGLSWRTGHVYISGTVDQTPVQVQGWL